MASYSADLRIGITGKTQLNALERQLGRINKDLNQINKSLKAQTLTINTKGATRALDQLDRKISRLNRSINVTANINEKRSQSGGGGGGGESTQLLAAAASPALLNQFEKNSQTVRREIEQRKKQLEDEAKGVDKIVKAYGEAEDAAAAFRAGEAKAKAKQDQISDLTRQRNAAAGQAKALQTRLNKGLIKNAEAVKKAKIQMAEYNALASDLSAKIGNANKGQGNLNRLLAEQNRLSAKAVDLQNKYTAQIEKRARYEAKRKGAVRGGLAAGALAASSVPGLGGAAQGALIGGGFGGAPGAIAGAAVGGITDLIGATVQYANTAARAAAEQEKFNTALRGITSGNDYQTALEDISELSEQFIQDIGTTTEQFTKLTAATTANGISVDETAEVYRGLAAANLALGGNAERLQGILLATGQVFSKGKVQAEELRGQIGERLPGAFALFAKAVGKTPAELDKALEKGEVTVEDFVKFTKALFEQYGENAKIIRDGPANAGARLEKALGDLSRNVGRLLAPIGAAFQDTFTAIVKAINAGIEALNRFLGIGTDNALAKVNSQLEDAGRRLQSVKGTRKVQVNQQIDRLLAEQKRLRALQQGQAQPVEKPTSTVEPPSGSSGGGSAGSAYESQAAALQAQRQYLEGILRLESDRIIGSQRIRDDQEYLMRQIEIELRYAKELDDLERQKLSAADRELTKQNLLLEKETELTRLNKDEAQRQFELKQAFDEQLRDLELQVALEQAITQEQRDQLQLRARLREIDGGPLSDEQKTKLKALEVELQQARDGNQGISGYMKQLQSEVMDTEAMIVSLSQTVVTQLSTAMRESVMGLIDGTKTAQEAFADMFKNIGAAFIDMATQMIAKALVMKALGILTSSSSGSNGFSGAPQMSGIPFSAGGISYEGGGYTGNGPRAGGLDGRGGFMAMVHPNETVIDHSSSMGRYAGGQGTGGSGGGTFKLETTVINGVEYATVDQVREMGMIATRDGAKQGQARTIRTLQNSRSQRTKLGINRR